MTQPTAAEERTPQNVWFVERQFSGAWAAVKYSVPWQRRPHIDLATRHVHEASSQEAAGEMVASLNEQDRETLAKQWDEWRRSRHDHRR